MTKELIIVALILLVIYLYYQKPSETAKTYFELDSQETEIKELKSQLQQAQQLESYNSQQLANYEAQVKRLKAEVQTLPEAPKGDWETRTAQTITELEQEIQSITEVLNKTENEVSDLTTERDEAIREKKTADQEN